MLPVGPAAPVSPVDPVSPVGPVTPSAPVGPCPSANSVKDALIGTTGCNTMGCVDAFIKLMVTPGVTALIMPKPDTSPVLLQLLLTILSPFDVIKAKTDPFVDSVVNVDIVQLTTNVPA